MFPVPWNPDKLDPIPGYRFLGRDETLKVTDEAWWETPKKEWRKTLNPGFTPYLTRITTYRRALNIDDPQAPPPEKWTEPGWEVFPDPVINYEPNPGEEYWATGSQVWYSAVHPNGRQLQGRWYIRRPINPSMNTPNLSVNWIPLQGPDSRYPTDAEAKAGAWIWTPCPTNPAGGFASSAKWSNAQTFKWCESKATHWAPITWPTPPKQILPPIPEVNGYQMTYTKGDDLVTFGCAKIDIKLFREANAFLNIFFGDKKGNRIVRGIVLSSGVEITTAQIDDILTYVDAVNKE